EVRLLAPPALGERRVRNVARIFPSGTWPPETALAGCQLRTSLRTNFPANREINNKREFCSIPVFEVRSAEFPTQQNREFSDWTSKSKSAFGGLFSVFLSGSGADPVGPRAGGGWMAKRGRRSPAPPIARPTLEKGDSGPAVAKVQRILGL